MKNEESPITQGELPGGDEKLPNWLAGLKDSNWKSPMLNDIFISYKSESISFVRPVADALIANGLRVWFNEYKLLDESYWTDDTLLAGTIGKGASSSSAALLFMDNAWASSYWCGEEMRHLRAALSDDRLLAVYLPQRSPDSPELTERKAVLASCHGLQYNGLPGLLNEINGLNWFQKKLALPEITAKKRLIKDRKINIRRINGNLYSMISARTLSFRWRFMRGWYEDTLYLASRLNDFVVSFHISYKPTRTLEYLEKFPDLIAQEDRQIFRELIPFADWWVKEGRGDHDPGGELVGIHLVKAPHLLQNADGESRGHFGATFRVDYGSVNNKVAWIRKYCFIIPNRGGCGELDLDFVFYIPKGTRAAEQKQYCELIGYVDAIVDSLSCYQYVLPER
jgi:hypothetical protein